MATDLTSEEAIINAYQKLVDERNALANATLDRQAEVEQHDLVIQRLKPMECGRKCFQLVGDVLVQSTVMEVLPTLEQTRNQLAGAAENIEKQFTAKGEEISRFEEKYKIRMKDDPSTTSKTVGKSNQGVLVGN